MRILIVDDSEDSRDITEAMLRAAGYTEVATAESATEAFNLLLIGQPAGVPAFQFDLILLDIVMENVDGIEACARIRTDPRYADLPIIMVTTLADIDSLANAFVAGATDYINKPLKQVELVARVRSALKLKCELDRRLARERDLLQFVSYQGDPRAKNWIDEATGLFVGAAAEAYLPSDTNTPSRGESSVIALVIDRIEAYRATQGEGMAAGIITQVAGAVCATAASIGVIAAAYGNGAMVLILPGLQPQAALELGEALRIVVSKLAIANPESIVANHFTASVAVVTGRAARAVDRVNLLTRAVLSAPRLSAAGGDRVVPEYA
jgi:sigma-B regulation protein RsbU (phosphoserine phosphatase)